MCHSKNGKKLFIDLICEQQIMKDYSVQVIQQCIFAIHVLR